MATNAKRIALTLVELVTALAILATLAAILIPTLTSAREATRRAACQRKLQQLGNGLSQFHQQHKRFPRNARKYQRSFTRTPYQDNPGQRRHEGVLVELLPYIGYSHIYDEFDFRRPLLMQNNSDGKMISRIRVTDFRCPSDPTEHIFYDRGPTSYAVSIGSQFMPGNLCHDYPGNTFGTGPSAFGFEARGNMVSGAFGAVSYSSRNRDFRDGLSQVFLVGEMIADKRFGVSGWADNGLTGSWAATSTPLNFPIKGKGRRGHLGSDCFSRLSYQTAFSFQSAHPDGANFLFADGHTQFVHERIDYLTYQRLGDRRDGGLVSLAK